MYVSYEYYDVLKKSSKQKQNVDLFPIFPIFPIYFFSKWTENCELFDI